jgi:hypothetical protein
VSEGERLKRLHQVHRNDHGVITLVVIESATREPKTAKPPTMGPAAMMEPTKALTNSMVTTRMFCGDDESGTRSCY